uniref:Uncharacterized protein n=1 Tax=Fagus sylvatica TaxID=28930 RepID=A0A2N9FGY4_FAGSY
MTSHGETSSTVKNKFAGLRLPSLDDLTFVHKNFRGLQNINFDNINFELKGYRPKTFEDSDLLDAESYKLTILQDSELTPIAKSFLKALENNTIGATTANHALLLASQLRSVETGRTKTQLVFSDFFSTTGSPIPIEIVPEEPCGTDQSGFLKWACFVAAYSLRLLVKNPQNAERSWENMKRRYSGFYIGMHAYKLFLDLLKADSKLSEEFLLNAMRRPETAKALSTIAEIRRDHESRGSNYFKYARLIGPQFFMPLQTKQCPDFVYLEVCLLKKFPTFTENQDPGSIAGLDILCTKLRMSLSRRADAIYEASQKNQATSSNEYDDISHQKKKKKRV